MENQEQEVQSQQGVNPFSEENWVEQNQEQQVQAQEEEPEQNQEDGEEYEEQEPQGFRYENELSEQIHKALMQGKHDEVYSFLERRNKFEKLSTAEIKDRAIAEDIVKTHMRLKYNDLTDDEINYKFNRSYKLPKEPQQELTETDEEFKDRMDEYNQKVQDINTELMIEAKTIRPEIAKQRMDIKLPSMKDPKSPEDLARQEAYVESFYRQAESNINDFAGMNVEYKDEGMSFVSNYTPSIEEKQQIADMMDNLATSEFDANTLFAERWVNDDYTLNTKQMAEDLWFFQNKDRIVQKLVNDAVSKRISEYRKQTSNINVSGGNSGSFNPANPKSDLDKMAEHFFSN